MAFLDKPFDHDVFVSFDHGLDQKFSDWMHELVKEVESEILDYEREMINLSVLVGKRSDAQRPLTMYFNNKVKASGVILVMMSQKFLDSPWCGEEMEWFEKELRDNLQKGGQTVLLLCEPTDERHWPAYLKQIREKIEFYANQSDGFGSGGPKPLGFPRPKPDDRAFVKAVTNLSTVVVGHLQKIKESSRLKQESMTVLEVNRPVDKPKIYLHPRPSHLEAWNDAKGILQDSGCDVIPDVPDKVGNDLWEIERAREMRLRILNEEANAACIIRVDTPVEQDIQLLASDRTALRVLGKNMPCALIDRVGGSSVLAKQLGIETVEAVSRNWQTSFQNWLRQTVYSGQ